MRRPLTLRSPDQAVEAKAVTRNQLPFLAQEPQPGKNSLSESHLKRESFSVLSATTRELPSPTWEAARSEVVRGPSVSPMETGLNNRRGFQKVLDWHAREPETSTDTWQETGAAECVTLKHSASRSLCIWRTPAPEWRANAHSSRERRP